MKKMINILICICLFLFMTGCQRGNKDLPTSSNKEHTVVKVNGSTSMEKLINGVAELIKEDYPNINIEPQFTGSSAGIESVLNNTSDIGNSSRSLKESEKSKGLVGTVVAIDGIVIVTNKNNTVTSLTKEELIAIYTGEIRNWKEVGGEDLPIVVIGREAGSGTRNAFEELLGIEYLCTYAQEINESGAVVAKVQSIPGSIGYISLDLVSSNIKPLAIDGVPASIETIRNREYSLQRPFIMVTKGDVSLQKEEVQQIFKFLNSSKGKAFIEKIGLIAPN